MAQKHSAFLIQLLCKKDGHSANAACGPLGRNSPIFAWQLPGERSFLFLVQLRWCDRTRKR